MRALEKRVLVARLMKEGCDEYVGFGEVISRGREVTEVKHGDSVYFTLDFSKQIKKHDVFFFSILESEILAVEEEFKNCKCECNH